MFTGIVEEIGCVTGIAKRGRYIEMSIHSTLDDLNIGDSIAINGACFTIIKLARETFTVGVTDTTYKTISSFKMGQLVNLERALQLGKRIGGHIVTGHVDMTTRIMSRKIINGSILYSIKIPPKYIKYCIDKGSIAIDGISLTIYTVSHSVVTVSVIPHTNSTTTMNNKRGGDMVNIEFDHSVKNVQFMYSNLN